MAILRANGSILKANGKVLVDAPSGLFVEFFSELVNDEDKPFYKKRNIDGYICEYIDIGKTSFNYYFTKPPKIVEFDFFYASDVTAFIFGILPDMKSRPHRNLNNVNYYLFTSRESTSGLPNMPTIIGYSGAYSNWIQNSIYIPGGVEYGYYNMAYNIGTGRLVHYKYEIDYDLKQVKISVNNAYLLLQFEELDVRVLTIFLEAVPYRTSVCFRSLHIVY